MNFEFYANGSASLLNPARLARYFLHLPRSPAPLEAIKELPAELRRTGPVAFRSTEAKRTLRLGIPA